MALDIAAQKDKSMEEKEKEAKDERINVVIGQRPEVHVTDKLEESASGRGKGGKARSGQENYEEVGGAPEGSTADTGVTNFFT